MDCKPKVLSSVINDYLNGRGSSHVAVEMSNDPKSALTENLWKEVRCGIEKLMNAVQTHIEFSVWPSCTQQTHLFVHLPLCCFGPVSWTKLTRPWFRKTKQTAFIKLYIYVNPL